MLVAITLVAAACGGDDDDATQDTGDPTPSVTDTSPATETETETPATSVVPDEVPADSTPPSAEEVTLASAIGEVSVPVTSERVVALDEFSAVMLISLGVTPHAVTNFRDDPSHISVVEATGIEPLEYGNLEVLATTDPGLIVGVTGHSDHRDLAGPLGELAPIFLTDPDDATWQGQLRALAAVTGTESRAELIIERIESRIEQFAERVRASEFAGSTISIITEFGPDDFWAFAPPVLSAEISSTIGFERPVEQAEAAPEAAGFIQLSAEIMPTQVADITISMAGPLTGGMSALDNDLVPESRLAVDVDGFGWGLSSPLTAWWILDDFESILFGDGSTYRSSDTLAVWGSVMSEFDG